MSGPNAQKRLSSRHETTAGIVNEWFQSLPYPQNQRPRHDLIRELSAHIDDLIQAAYTVAKEDQNHG